MIYLLELLISPSNTMLKLLVILFVVKRFIFHTDYFTDFIIAAVDVALLELKKSTLLNDYVNLPCMPEKGVYPSKKSLFYFADMIIDIFLLLLRKYY